MAAELPTGTVTFLFTDIEGSTRLVQDLRDDYPALLERHAAILRAAIQRGEGDEVKTEGDSFFAVFRTASGAIRAAVDAQRALAAEAWPGGEDVRVRMGAHTGEGRLGTVDYVGLDVHRAARIAAAGHGGQVLLSDATRALVGEALPEGVTLRDLGRHRLKDIELPEHLFQLVMSGLPAEFAPLRALDVPRTNLVAPRTSFVGRQRDLAEIRRLVGANRLVTLTGPGGTGKTRLALEVASGAREEHVDGVYFVDLSTVTDAAGVPSVIVRALSLREDPRLDLLEWLVGYLGDRDMLLVLDNLEQVTGAADVIGRLLDGASGLHVLATSREPLHLSGEQEYPVAPMMLPPRDAQADPAVLSTNDSVALFVARARSVQPDFALTAENAAAVAELTVRLDGLPLAIELAASRVKLLPPAVLLSRLGERLPMLTTAARDLPERQRTLRAAIDWSCDLLEASERRLFARLSVFAGGWALESAEAVCSEGLEMPVLDVLGALVDKSLVQEEADPRGGPRFRMLETIREYALGLLDRSGEEAALRGRHARHFMDLAERAQPGFESADQLSWFIRFDREAENVRAAFEWCSTSGEALVGARLATAIWRYWAYRGRLRDGRAWLERFLASPALAGRDVLRFRATTALGGLAYWENDYAAMDAAYEEALAIARELGDPALIGEALYDASYIAAIRGDDARATALNREALVHAEEAGDRSNAADIRATLAFATFFAGEHAEGLALLSGAVAVARESGNALRVAGLVLGLGVLSHLSGDRAAAHRHLAEAITIARDVGSRGLQAESLLATALVAAREGSFERAARLIGAAARLREGFETRSPIELVGRLGDPESEAKRALGETGFGDERAEGYAMPSEAAIAFALKGEQEPQHDG